MNLFWRILLWIGVSFLAAIVGGIGTSIGLGPWYESLNKPALNPPNWVFAPVWTTLYTLMGMSMGLMDWLTARGQDPSRNRQIKAIFLTQIVLNALWPLAFFAAGWFWLGLVIIVALECTISLWIFKATRISHLAAAMLIPYFCWVGFATYLNAALAWLNS